MTLSNEDMVALRPDCQSEWGGQQTPESVNITLQQTNKNTKITLSLANTSSASRKKILLLSLACPLYRHDRHLFPSLCLHVCNLIFQILLFIFYGCHGTPRSMNIL